MYRVIYYITVFIVISGIGMAVANRKEVAVVRRQRWLKYVMYIFITGVVIASIFFHFFPWIAALIILASWLELYKVNRRAEVKRSTTNLSWITFLPVAVAFLFFAGTFNEPFLLFIYFQVLIFDGFCQITGQLFG